MNEAGAAVAELLAVTKRYGRRTVLDGLDLRVGRGEIVGLLGPNGSGKTTTLRIAAGYLWADRGEVRIGGERLTPATTPLRSRIGYLPERVPLYDPFTIAGHLDFIAGARGLRGAARRTAVDRVCAAFDLEAERKRVIGQLSKGFRQRIGLAQALLGEPDLVLLDEPTNGLDPFQIVEARAMIRAAGRDRGVVISTHILQEVAALCTRVVFLRDGRLIELPGVAAPEPGTACVVAVLRDVVPATLGAALAAFDADYRISDTRALGDGAWRLTVVLADTPARRARLARWLAAQGSLLEFGTADPSSEDLLAMLSAVQA